MFINYFSPNYLRPGPYQVFLTEFVQCYFCEIKKASYLCWMEQVTMMDYCKHSAINCGFDALHQDLIVSRFMTFLVITDGLVCVCVGIPSSC